MNTAIFPAPTPLARRAAVLQQLQAPKPGSSGPGLSGEAEQAVFLHTGWRSGGTWIWSECRRHPSVYGYYEPLHEHAARFRRRDVAQMRPGSWRSNHSETAPYFEEYRDLIPPFGRGVAQYQRRFAFDGFFRAPGDPPDPELEAYIASLLARPLAEGRRPVLKFCRSMGRVGWFEKRFPQALHAVVLRDPMAQYQSGERLLLAQRNRYFVLAPLLVLARNAADPLVRDAALTLGVNLPALYSDDMEYAVETCWAHVRRLSPAERYRGFLAFWTLSALSALDSDAMVIDIDAIGDDLAHRCAVQAALGARIGAALHLAPRVAGEGAPPPPGLREAHGAADVLVQAWRGRLSPQRIDLVREKLIGDGATAAPLPDWPAPHLPASDRRGGVGTMARVYYARAIQPLRRLHGAIALAK